jgi:hypothetical protein
LFRHLLLQIGGANIEYPPTSSSLAEEERLRSLLLSTAVRDFPTLAAVWSCSRNRAVSIAAPLAAMFAGLPPSSSDLAERKALFRHLLLQIGGANIEYPPTSSSLAEEERLRSLGSALLAPLAEAGAR